MLPYCGYGDRCLIGTIPVGSSFAMFRLRRCGSFCPVLPAYSTSSRKSFRNERWTPKVHCDKHGVRFSRSNVNGFKFCEDWKDGSMSLMKIVGRVGSPSIV